MTDTSQKHITLDEQYAAFTHNRFIAMPIAGTIAWFFIGVAGFFLPIHQAALALYIGTGSIFYLGLGVAKLTGEDLLGRERKTDFFDRIFMQAMGASLMVFAIAIPFALIEPTSLPLSIGILTGTMWLPFSGLIRHWVGIFHTVTRTILILVAWYLFPEARFVVIPGVIVFVYLISIYVLVRRYDALSRETETVQG